MGNRDHIKMTEEIDKEKEDEAEMDEMTIITEEIDKTTEDMRPVDMMTVTTEDMMITTEAADDMIVVTEDPETEIIMMTGIAEITETVKIEAEDVIETVTKTVMIEEVEVL